MSPRPTRRLLPTSHRPVAVSSEVGHGRQRWLQKWASLISASGRTVVAEGVERPAQADFLRQVGVQMAQGWLYSKPLRAPGFVAWHAAHR
jgi:EAL domain-containing protein (putative c-di-GMP-specific phosphodiesterase class I)